MARDCLTRTGKLKKEYLPAIYFDSTVTIDYFIVEGTEIDLPEDARIQWDEHEKVLRKLFRKENKLDAMTDVRKALVLGDSRINVVTSPIAMCEMIEWKSRAALKTMATSAVGAPAIERCGNKDIGEKLKTIIESRKKEIKLEKKGQNKYSTGFEILVAETFFGSGFVRSHALDSVIIADIRNFAFSEIDVWKLPELLAYLQVGAADIMHLLIAKHLGCNYFASWDSDFERCQEYIEKDLKMKLISKPTEILKVLKKN
ncbi:MAG TPA: PIN domain-containing protein [Acidobacteriota bacterium]|nr:PIN domain-containing protein [Acidobacteriota bacterium]